VAFEIEQTFVVFQDEGVSEYSINVDGDFLPPNSWALSDSSATNKQPCTPFLRAARMRRTWIIQATSPSPERWKSWKKDYNATFFVMEPFSIDEMTALGLAIWVSEVFLVRLFSPYTYSEVLSLNSDDLRRNYMKWGPSGRICVQCSRKLKSEREHANLVLLDVKRLVKTPNSLEDPMAVPHRLFALHPLDKDDDSDSAGRTIPKAKIATPHIGKLISYEIAATEARGRVLSFQSMSKQPMLRSAAGTVFERFVL
jgi:hypothetical protein